MRFKHLAPLLVALVLALVGQVFLAQRTHPLDGVLLYLVAALVCARALPRSNAPAAEKGDRAPPRVADMSALRVWRLGMAGAALILGLAGAWLFNLYQATNLGLVLWLASMVAVLVAFADGRLPVAWPRPTARGGLLLRPAAETDGTTALPPAVPLPLSSGRLGTWLRPRREAVLLVLIMAVALFMRVNQLDTVPSGIYLDAADSALTSIKVLEKPYTPFTPERDANTTLFYYALGLSIRLFGNTLGAVHLATLLIGLATVLALYFLARLLFGVPAALAATFLLAVARWHVNFSRIAFEALLIPLFEILAAYFLLRGLRAGRLGWFAWAGVAFGLGFSSYIGYRIFPVIVLAYLVYLAVSDRGFLRLRWRGLLVFVVAALLAFAPLGVFVVKQPEVFLRRMEAASVLNDISRQKSNQPLYDNIRKSLLMFNAEGDPRPRHNLPGEPMLDAVSRVVFALGLGLALLGLRDRRYFLLVAWLLLGLAPGVFSLADSNPHSLRTIGNVPAVFLLCAVFLERLLAAVEWPLRRALRPVIVPAGIAGALLLAAGLNYHTYFDIQASARSVWYDFDPAMTAAAQLMRARADDSLVIASHSYTNYSAAKFLAYGLPVESLQPNRHVPPLEPIDRDLVYILDPVQAALLPQLKTLYPTARLTEQRDRFGGLMFYVFTATREQALAVQGLAGKYFRSTDWSGAAVERTREQIDFDWEKAGPPVPFPFSATWQGALLVPRFGEYQFRLAGPASVELRLDGKPVLAEGTGRGKVTLPGGFHDVELKAIAQAAEKLQLLWTPPGEAEEVVPVANLYGLPLGRNGLLARYYRGSAWQGNPALVQIEPFLVPNEQVPTPYSVEWTGRIYIPQDGRYAFGTNSDDGSLLWIDDRPVVDNGGHHANRYVEGAIQLAAGGHDVRLRYFDDGGGRALELWWTPPGSAKSLVPVTQLFPPDKPVENIVVAPPPLPALSPVTPPPGLAALPTAGQSVIGAAGDREGQFKQPRGVATDGAGNIYVADTGNRRLQKLAADGRFTLQFGREERLEEPFDVAVGPEGTVYVADPPRDRVAKFDGNGRSLGSLGEGLAFFRPRGVAVDGSGNLYVADTGKNRVVKISPSGEVLQIFGGGSTRLEQPTDVAVDADGNVYVAEPEASRLQKLAPDGRFVQQWGLAHSDTVTGVHLAIYGGTLYATDPGGRRVVAFGLQGATLGELTGGDRARAAVGIAVDGTGSVLVADSGGDRLIKYAAH